MFNKKGNVFAQNSLYVLTALFGLGILTLLVINPILHGYVKPALLSSTSGSMNVMLTEKYDFITGFTDLLPYMLFLTGIVYLLVLIFRKERVDMYG